MKNLTFDHIKNQESLELEGRFFNLLFYYCDGDYRAQIYHQFTDGVISEDVITNTPQVQFQIEKWKFIEQKSNKFWNSMQTVK